MGRIGGEVARRAIAFGMRVMAFDPYLSAGTARRLQVELTHAASGLEEASSSSDSGSLEKLGV